MTKNNRPPSDPVWDIAWTWVQRQYEAENFTDADHAQLAFWLKENPAHIKAYDKAARLWLSTGMVPSSQDSCVPPQKSHLQQADTNKPLNDRRYRR
jgi:transmembrane sensor